VVTSRRKVKLSNLPVDAYHPFKSRVKLYCFQKEDGKICVKTVEPSLKYLIINEKSKMCSGLLEIKAGEPHELKMKKDDLLTILFEQ